MDHCNFMNVKQVADYIHLNEKKVYSLVNEGEIPATKVTGKWMFPRELIDRWLLDSSHGGLLTDRLCISGGDDPLLYRTVLRFAQNTGSRAMISYTPTGTRQGLDLMQVRRTDASAMRWGPESESSLRHPALLSQYGLNASWVLIHAFKREQGVMIAPPVARYTHQTEDLFDPQFRWAMRQPGSGGQRFLLEVLAHYNLSSSDLRRDQHNDIIMYSEREAAAAISMDLADVAPGSRATATEFGLSFISLGWESFDLVLSKTIWFRHLFQALIKEMKSPLTLKLAKELEGYDLSTCGELRWGQE